jgi:uracil-DNA glycosylase family 4
MQAQALAILDWYVAMGVDETLGEDPHDWKKPELATHIAVTPSIIGAPAILSASATLDEVSKLAAAASTLADLEATIKAYKGLAICRTATNPVFAEGVANAPLMVIGEAPGAEEDRRGVPFCGSSGQLLDKILAAIGLSRSENAYITNSLFWRPPGNRTPSVEEIITCRPFLEKHIELQNPMVILLMGSVAIRALLNNEIAISKLRGNPLSYKDIPVIVTYHPSYLLRQPSQKKLAWEDMLALKEHTKLLT